MKLGDYLIYQHRIAKYSHNPAYFDDNYWREGANGQTIELVPYSINYIVKGLRPWKFNTSDEKFQELNMINALKFFSMLKNKDGTSTIAYDSQKEFLRGALEFLAEQI